jgi:hypothetical protein
MHIENQVYTIKPEQKQEGLPLEVTITRIDEEAGTILLESDQGTYKSTLEILDTFYSLKKEVTSEEIPALAVRSIDELLCLFDIFAASHDPLSGIQVKTKLLLLKESLSKLTIAKPEVKSLLGQKID